MLTILLWLIVAIVAIILAGTALFWCMYWLTVLVLSIGEWLAASQLRAAIVTLAAIITLLGLAAPL